MFVNFGFWTCWAIFVGVRLVLDAGIFGSVLLEESVSLVGVESNGGDALTTCHVSLIVTLLN